MARCIPAGAAAAAVRAGSPGPRDEAGSRTQSRGSGVGEFRSSTPHSSTAFMTRASRGGPIPDGAGADRRGLHARAEATYVTARETTYDVTLRPGCADGLSWAHLVDPDTSSTSCDRREEIKAATGRARGEELAAYHDRSWRVQGGRRRAAPRLRYPAGLRIPAARPRFHHAGYPFAIAMPPGALAICELGHPPWPRICYGSPG